MKMCGMLNLSKEDVKTLFFDNNKMIHESLNLPASLKKAWDMIENEICSDGSRDKWKFL